MSVLTTELVRKFETNGRSRRCLADTICDLCHYTIPSSCSTLTERTFIAHSLNSLKKPEGFRDYGQRRTFVCICCSCVCWSVATTCRCKKSCAKFLSKQVSKRVYLLRGSIRMPLAAFEQPAMAAFYRWGCARWQTSSRQERIETFRERMV